MLLSNASLAPQPLPIMGSRHQQAQILMNLLLNALEAIDTAGKVVIETRRQSVLEVIKGYDQIDPGEYALLSIADDGSGIAPKDLQRIFEPFYSKKMLGKSGTGLGMAIVWGAVKDHYGYIDVVSSAQRGTTFHLYFPIIEMEGKYEQKGI